MSLLILAAITTALAAYALCIWCYFRFDGYWDFVAMQTIFTVALVTISLGILGAVGLQIPVWLGRSPEGSSDLLWVVSLVISALCGVTACCFLVSDIRETRRHRRSTKFIAPE